MYRDAGLMCRDAGLMYRDASLVYRDASLVEPERNPPTPLASSVWKQTNSFLSPISSPQFYALLPTSDSHAHQLLPRAQSSPTPLNLSL